MSIESKMILNGIAKEIESKHNCKVIDIDFAQLLSLCVRVKVKFNDDVIYKPFEDLPNLLFICFSERTVIFHRRVDLFDFVKNNSNQN